MTRRGVFGLLAAAACGLWRKPSVAVVEIDGREIARASVDAWHGVRWNVIYIDELYEHKAANMAARTRVCED